MRSSRRAIEVDALVAMNPAALVTNLGDLDQGRHPDRQQGRFRRKRPQAWRATRPIRWTTSSLDSYRLFPVEMTKLTRLAVDDLGLGMKESDRCRNFFAMGLVFWLYDRPLDTDAAVHRGQVWQIASRLPRPTAERFTPATTTARRPRPSATTTRFPRPKLAAGQISQHHRQPGTGLGPDGRRGAKRLRLFLGSLSDHAGQRHSARAVAVQELRRAHVSGGRRNRRRDLGHRRFVRRRDGRDDFQRPGHRVEARGDRPGRHDRAAADHLNVQRGGPSTGLPTKTEQADLLQAMLRPQRRVPACRCSPRAGPADCFDVAQEAWRIAVALHDAGDSAERRLHRQRLRAVADSRMSNRCGTIEVEHPSRANQRRHGFMPYERDERLARPWALPGTPGLMHRIGGLEKQDITGNVNYEPANHQHMVDLRAAKVAGIARDIPQQEVDGPDRGKLLVLSWGGTYGACATAVREARADGASVAHAHLRYLNPFPATWAKSSAATRKCWSPS